MPVKSVYKQLKTPLFLLKLLSLYIFFADYIFDDSAIVRFRHRLKENEVRP